MGNCTSSLDNVWSFPIVEKEFEEQEQDVIAVKSCACSHKTVETNDEKYFKVSQLFSELRTEYDKHIARQNLGLSDSDSLLWGNLKGTLENQKDLITFVNNTIQEQVNLIKSDYNSKILELLNKINNSLSELEIFFGESLDNLDSTNEMTFTTGAYESNIIIITPNNNTKFYIGGIEGGFILQAAEYYVKNVRYYIYKSTYTNLGATTITLKYGETS